LHSTITLSALKAPPAALKDCPIQSKTSLLRSPVKNSSKKLGGLVLLKERDEEPHHKGSSSQRYSREGKRYTHIPDRLRCA
jgi:hypothetical protein